MSRLSQALDGKPKEPFRIVFYADPGFGKSTLGSMLERPFFIRTEEGLVDSKRMPIRQNFDDIILDIKALIDETHDYKTLVIDTFDGIERLTGDVIAKKEEVESVVDVGWNKGPGKVAEKLRRVLRGLDRLQIEKQMNILILSHVHITKIKSPMVEAYDKFSPAINKEVGELLEAWPDAILFGTFKTIVSVTSKTDKKPKAMSDGSRIIYCQSRPAYMAKNRFGLPEKIEVETPEDVLAIFNTIKEK